MRSICRVVDCSYDAVDKLLKDAGIVCAEFHDRAVRGVKSQRVLCDEVWSFVRASGRAARAAAKEAWPV